MKEQVGGRKHAETRQHHLAEQSHGLARTYGDWFRDWAGDTRVGLPLENWSLSHRIQATGLESSEQEALSSLRPLSASVAHPDVVHRLTFVGTVALLQVSRPGGHTLLRAGRRTRR